MRNFIRITTALFTAVALSTSLVAAPVDSAELDALRAQVRALEQQLKVIARQLEIKEEAAAAAAPTAPKITVNDKGVTLASADAANSVRLRGLVQLDNRLFFGDDASLTNNAFVLRRARLNAEGVFAKNYSFLLTTEFAGSSVSILDAYLGISLTKAAQVRIGKFKSPVGYELLQSDAWTFFNERSIATNLVGNRDLGVQLGGELAEGRVNYSVGVFNGVADGASSNNADFDNEKDVAGRVSVSPFKNDPASSLQGLSFGVGGSIGREKTASGRTSGYRTDGQQTFFSYNTAVIADGQNWRFSPLVDYRAGSLGVVGEYVVSTVNVRPGAGLPKAELQNKAWQLAAGYVLTGEDSSYAGVVPASNFDWSKGTWGAFEVTGRVSNLKIDDAAFPLFASPAASAEEATAFGLGLNWYLSKAVVFKIDYYQTNFDLNAAAPASLSNAVLRDDERSLITRFQLTF